MKNDCNFYKDQQSYEGVVKALYQKSFDQGFSMDTDGFKFSRILVAVLQFMTKGPQSFLLNKHIKFAHDQQINNSTILGIELMGSTNQLHAVTTPQTDFPQTEYKKGFLVLVDDCEMKIIKIPLSMLCRALNGNTIPMFNISNINWAACYVQFNSAAAITAANSLRFNIYV